MSNVVPLKPCDVPDIVLEAAKGNLDTVIIVGVDKEGCEYFASSTGDASDMLWLISRFKKELLDIDE